MNIGNTAGRNLFLRGLALAATLALWAFLPGCGGGNGDRTSNEVTSANGTQGGTKLSEGETSGDGEAKGQSSSASGSAQLPKGGAAESPAGDEGEENGEQPSSEELIAKSDSICHRWGRKIEADALKDFNGDLNGSKAAQREGIESLAESVEKYLVTDLEAEQREVRALVASSTEAQEAQAIAVASIGTLIDVGKTDPEGLIVGTSQTKEGEANARSYGFTACGSLTGHRAV